MKHLMLAAALLLGAATSSRAQTTANLSHPAPDQVSIALLLTDGTVLAQGMGGSDWWKLTPDINGSYVHGTWARQADLPSGYVPLYFASAVLADGRVVVAGGEYNDFQFAFIDTCVIYDPLSNKWKKIKPPAKWHFIGDSPSAVLPNGSFLLGRKFDKRIAVLNPSTLTWTELRFTGKKDFNAEEGWTLLPNGTVLTEDVKGAPNAEFYDPSAQIWTSTGATPVDLAGPPTSGPIDYGHNKVYHPPGEIGPAMLRPDGTVFATGDTPSGGNEGHTAIYTPGANGSTGTWKAGPDFAPGDDSGDSFAALLPTGNVLVEAESGSLYEFDGTHLTKTKFATPGPLSGEGALLVLPTGEVLLGGDQVYRAAGTVNPAWAPTITSVPAELTRGKTYVVSGTQFNGLSQANAFGDELETATNYPLVRITNAATSHVFYARTHDHSSMGVATGSAIISTNFDVPAAAETGASTLVVVANGIASTATAVTIK